MFCFLNLYFVHFDHIELYLCDMFSVSRLHVYTTLSVYLLIAFTIDRRTLQALAILKYIFANDSAWNRFGLVHMRPTNRESYLISYKILLTLRLIIPFSYVKIIILYELFHRISLPKRLRSSHTGSDLDSMNQRTTWCFRNLFTSNYFRTQTLSTVPKAEHYTPITW